MGEKLTAGLLVFLIAKELWDIVKKSIFSKSDALVANTEATIKNTVAIEYLRADLIKLSHIPIDVNEAHTKIRAIEDRVKILEN